MNNDIMKTIDTLLGKMPSIDIDVTPFWMIYVGAILFLSFLMYADRVFAIRNIKNGVSKKNEPLKITSSKMRNGVVKAQNYYFVLFLATIFSLIPVQAAKLLLLTTYARYVYIEIKSIFEHIRNDETAGILDSILHLLKSFGAKK